MAQQLIGVLREVLAVADGKPRPAFSTLFSPEPQTIGVPAIFADGGPDAMASLLSPPNAAAIAAGLPVPLVDPADPAASYLATLGTVEPSQLTVVLAGAVAGQGGTPRRSRTPRRRPGRWPGPGSSPVTCQRPGMCWLAWRKTMPTTGGRSGIRAWPSWSLAAMMAPSMRSTRSATCCRASWRQSLPWDTPPKRPAAQPAQAGPDGSAPGLGRSAQGRAGCRPVRAAARRRPVARAGDHRAFLAVRSGEQLPGSGAARAGPATPDRAG